MAVTYGLNGLLLQLSRDKRAIFASSVMAASDGTDATSFRLRDCFPLGSKWWRCFPRCLDNGMS